MQSRATAIKLVLRLYGREMASRKALTIPALLAPALGNICNLYIAPLIVAMMVSRVAATGDPGFGASGSYILAFGGALFFAELLWRIGIHCLNRVDAYGIEHLYVVAIDELLAKDAAFFHNNFAGSLTKRSLSFAARFEQFVDTLAFEIMAALVPLIFASVVLWHYNPMLVVVLMGMIVVTALVITPLVQRRQKLVDDREAAIARVSGHVADSLANMQVVRAFAAEPQEADEHRRRVASSRRKSLRSWDYANLRIDTLVAPLLVLTNVMGLLIAVGLSGDNMGVEAIVVAFTYYFNATGIMFRFNQIYRRLETVLTEAAQFTELLLDEPRVLDAAHPEPLRPKGFDVRFDSVNFTHGGARQLFHGLDLHVPSGAKVGLVGRSGGGKTTITQLLLRLMDLQSGTIRIGGQDIARLRQADLRSLIAYVPQEPAMFHRTLSENIRFARPEATDEEILRGRRGRPCHRIRGRTATGHGYAHRRARRETLRRPAPTGRAGQGDPAGRTHPAPGRGDQRARLGERITCAASPLGVDGRPHRAGRGAPAEHRGRNGPAGGARPRANHRGRNARTTAVRAGSVRTVVAAPVGRIPGRGRGRPLTSAPHIEEQYGGASRAPESLESGGAPLERSIPGPAPVSERGRAPGSHRRWRCRAEDRSLTR